MSSAFAYRLKDSGSSESDSNDSDDECLNWKRITKNTDDVQEKIPLVPPPMEQAPAQSTAAPTLKRKRNTIWTEVLEDQMMSETLNHCLLKNKPVGYGSRGEESYDYTNSKRYREDDVSSEKSFKTNKKFRSDSHYVELDSASNEAAWKIIKVLAEQKGYLIRRVVKYLGIEKAMKLLKMTEDIEDSGGMMIMNQARRRTPGGVYLHLLRTDKDVDKDVIDKIFEGEMNSYEKKKMFQEKKKRLKALKKMKHEMKAKMECEEPSPDANIVNESERMDDDEMNVDKVPNPEAKETTSDIEEGEVE